MLGQQDNLYFPHVKRITQVNTYYCGPAVVQMLLSHLGIFVSQDQIVEAAGIEDKVKTWGMLTYDMGRTIANLFPDLQFWQKDEATVSELKQLVELYHYPVGVEWQGTFSELRDEDIAAHYGEMEDEDDDTGHYGVVTHVDTIGNEILMADPFGPYAGYDRKFTVVEFEKRWWDINEIVDQITNKKRHVHDYHMMFIVTPKSADFPENVGMRKVP